jgi:hypothetical protein
MQASVDELVEQVRHELDEVTLSGEMVLTDSSLEDRASSNFSNASIKDRLMDATRHIAARVRATYLKPFVITVTPADFDPPYDTTTPKILRLVGTQVTAEDSGASKIDATRRTMAAHLKLENGRGLNAREDYPVFVFEDFELLVQNGIDSVKEAKAVRVPGQEPAQKYSDVVALPDAFEGAVVAHAVSSCFETLRMAENATQSKKRLAEELREYRLPFRSASEQQEEE